MHAPGIAILDEFDRLDERCRKRRRCGGSEDVGAPFLQQPFDQIRRAANERACHTGRRSCFYREVAPGDPANFRAFGICSGLPQSGIYVLQVTASAGHSVNGFSIAASTATGPPPAVYGIGRMSIKANQNTASPTFRLVKVTPVYAGKRITVSLFDPGEVEGEGYVFFEGPIVSGME